MKDKMARLNTPEDVATLAVETLHSIIPTDKIALAVIEGNTLKSVHTYGERVIMDLNLDWPSINTRTVKTRRTQLVNDTSKDPDYFPGDGRDAVTMLSELCVPMTHREKVLGTINLESRQPGRFSEKDARVAEAFTQEIAKALHRVWTDRRKHRPKPVRTTTENYHEILKAVHEGTDVLNRIVYSTGIPWRRGKEMVNNLVSQGYLTKEKISAARYIYKITDKGIQAIDEYAHTPKCLDI